MIIKHAKHAKQNKTKQDEGPLYDLLLLPFFKEVIQL